MNLPEKIYLSPESFKISDMVTSIITTKFSGEDVEYVLFENFLKKVEEFLYKKLNDGGLECSNIEELIKDLRIHLKG